jgi:hypothetical protein
MPTGVSCAVQRRGLGCNNFLSWHSLKKPSRALLHQLLPWALAFVACALAALARTFLIQPPALAHACEATMAWWCVLRLWIIYTYAWHSIGQLALLLVVAALFVRQAWLAAAALAVGLCALVLYCYEPGAFAALSGALILLRRQISSRSRVFAPLHQAGQTQ